MRLIESDEYRLIGIPSQSQLVRETRLLHNRVYLQTSQSRLVVLLLAEFLLAFNLIVGDHFIFRSMTIIDLVRSRLGLSERLVRALMDSASHFSVAVFSWFIITYANNDSHQPNGISFKELFLVGLLASLVDIDHFIAAKSTSLLQAISLQKRPFLHNSLTLSICNLAVCILVSMASGSRTTGNRASSMFFTAWFTHHVRDANRRGIWFGFLFTTSPLPRALYLSIILLTPLLLRYDLCASLTRLLFTTASSQLAALVKPTSHETHII